MTDLANEAAMTDAGGQLLTLALDVNGRTEHVLARTQHTLLDVLRDRIGRIDTREGCGIGMCGACTVLLDGRVVSGCLVLAAQAEGRQIVTVEGLSPGEGELHPVQEAFIEHTGFQCSYCTPGFVLATKALLDEEPDADRESARAYLAGNLCRCGSYVKILDAVAGAREQMQNRDDRLGREATGGVQASASDEGDRTSPYAG